MGNSYLHLAGEGMLEMHLVLTPRTLPDKRSYNVIADLKGTDKPDEVIVVSGHLDSWDLWNGCFGRCGWCRDGDAGPQTHKGTGP